MAKVILYYIPIGFRKKVKWFCPELRGRVIEFTADAKESAGEQLNRISKTVDARPA